MVVITIAREQSIEKIRRHSTNKFSPDEVLVIFSDIMTRDTIIGSSGMLSEMQDKETLRPTAAIRIDVPEYLRADRKTLEEYGRRLRSVHGRRQKDMLSLTTEKEACF